MRLKLDENIDVRLAESLRAHGHDAHTVLDEGLGGAEDPAVLAAAVAEGRTLVTLDLDFANTLRFPPDRATGIVLLRPARATLPQVAALLDDALPELVRRELTGRLVVVEPGRLRIYPPES